MAWLAQNWGNLASVVGVALSVWVAIVATRAKTAANEAKYAIELRTLGSALRGCSDEVGAVERHLTARTWGDADTAAGRAQRDLSYITARWHTHVDAKSSEALALAANHLEKSRSQLRKYQLRLPKETELLALHTAIERVATLLAGELGKCESRIEVIVRHPPVEI